MPNPFDATGLGNVVPDPVLTNISIEFLNTTGYIADQLFPPVRVTKQSGRYLLFGRDHFATESDGDLRAPGARAREIEHSDSWAQDTYFADEHALELLVPDEEEENTDNPFSPHEDAAVELANKLALGKEIAARDLAYDDTQYKANHVVTLGAGEKFDDYGATSDPIGVFRTAFRDYHRSTGTVPNLAVIPWEVMSYLEDHPKVIERFQAQGGVITAQQIATVLGLQKIVVPGAQSNTANPGQANVLADIWTDNIVLASVPARPSRRTPAFGYNFWWPTRTGGKNIESVLVDTRRDDDRIGDIHRSRMRYDLKLVGRDPDLSGTPLIAGYLIKDVLDAV